MDLDRYYLEVKTKISNCKVIQNPGLQPLRITEGRKTVGVRISATIRFNGHGTLEVEERLAKTKTTNYKVKSIRRKYRFIRDGKGIFRLEDKHHNLHAHLESGYNDYNCPPAQADNEGRIFIDEDPSSEEITVLKHIIEYVERHCRTGDNLLNFVPVRLNKQMEELDEKTGEK